MATIDDFGGSGDALNSPPLGGPSGWAAAVRDALRELQERPLLALEKGTVGTGDADFTLTPADNGGYTVSMTLPALGDSTVGVDALVPGAPGLFDVRSFGAVGDGATDDAAAIQACIAAASAVGGVVLVPGSTSGYRANSTITVPATVGGVLMDAPILSAASGVGIQVGSSGSTVTNRRFRLSVTRVAQSDWSSDLVIGVQFVNLDSCVVDVVQASGFTLGVQCIGINAGFQENIVTLGMLRNNRVSVDLTNSGTGWCNENLFLGGNVGVGTGVNPTKTRIGIRSTSAGTYRNNGNIFLKPAFELNAPNLASKGTVTFTDAGDLVTVSAAHNCSVNDAVTFGTITTTTGITAGTVYYVASVPTATTMTLSATPGGPTLALTGDGSSVSVKGEALPILIERGSQIRALYVRAENVSATTARVLNNSQDCEIRTGFGTCKVDDFSSIPSSFGWSGTNHGRELPSRLVFDSGPMHRTAMQVGVSSLNIPRVHVGTTGSAAATSSGVGTINADYVEFPFGYGVGIFVSCLTTKTFVVRAAVESGYGGRFQINAYDAAGTQLDSSYPVYADAATGALAWTTGYGGGWSTQADTPATGAAMLFRAPPEAAFVRVLMKSGTAALRIRSFRVEVPDAWSSLPTAWAGYEEIIPGVNISNGAPTGGTHAAGRMVYNRAPAVGQPLYWVCTSAGTPGTWVAGPNL